MKKKTKSKIKAAKKTAKRATRLEISITPKVKAHLKKEAKRKKITVSKLILTKQF
jgi:hypothetical protein